MGEAKRRGVTPEAAEAGARRRIEQAIPARLLFTVACCGAFACYGPDGVTVLDEDGHKEVERLKANLAAASAAPFLDMEPRARSRIYYRMEEITEEATKDWTDQRAVKVALTVFYFFDDLIAAGLVVDPEPGSPLDEAVTVLMPMLEAANDHELIAASARKQARRLLEHFQRRGFYA